MIGMLLIVEKEIEKSFGLWLFADTFIIILKQPVQILNQIIGFGILRASKHLNQHLSLEWVKEEYY